MGLSTVRKALNKEAVFDIQWALIPSALSAPCRISSKELIISLCKAVGSEQARYILTFSRLGYGFFVKSRALTGGPSPHCVQVNYSFSLILFAVVGGPPPARIAQAEQAEHRALTPSFETNSPQHFITCHQSLIIPVGAVFVAVVVRLIVTPTDRKILLSSPPPSLPPALLIYGRDEFIQNIVGKILQTPGVKKHVSIRGGPGMGKTAAATGIMHHPRIVQHFGDARHWVYCREASDIADGLKSQKLLEFISDSLGLDLMALSDSRKNIKYFLDNNDVPRIIVLDNFETMWEPPTAQEETEGVLTFLSRFPRLTMIITTRNAHDPATHLGDRRAHV